MRRHILQVFNIEQKSKYMFLKTLLKSLVCADHSKVFWVLKIAIEYTHLQKSFLSILKGKGQETTKIANKHVMVRCKVKLVIHSRNCVLL